MILFLAGMASKADCEKEDYSEVYRSNVVEIEEFVKKKRLKQRDWQHREMVSKDKNIAQNAGVGKWDIFEEKAKRRFSMSLNLEDW